MIARRKGMDMRTLERKVRLVEIVSVLSNGKERVVGYIEEDILEGFIWTNNIR
jgi:hypothetical protein